MSFLDKLLGRNKTAAGDTEDNSVKGEGMHEEQEIASNDDDAVLEEGDLKGQLGGPASDDIDPQFIKDTERRTS